VQKDSQAWKGGHTAILHFNEDVARSECAALHLPWLEVARGVVTGHAQNFDRLLAWHGDRRAGAVDRLLASHVGAGAGEPSAFCDAVATENLR